MRDIIALIKKPKKEDMLGEFVAIVQIIIWVFQIIGVPYFITKLKKKPDLIVYFIGASGFCSCVSIVLVLLQFSPQTVILMAVSFCVTVLAIVIYLFEKNNKILEQNINTIERIVNILSKEKKL